MISHFLLANDDHVIQKKLNCNHPVWKNTPFRYFGNFYKVLESLEIIQGLREVKTGDSGSAATQII